jgi:ABC-type antimicrobial peptide transport system permease subunit
MQEPPAVIGLAARTVAEPESFAGAVRSLPDVAPTAEVRDPAPLEERVERAVAPLRWFGSMFAIIAAAAFGFAVHGVLAAVRAATLAQRRELAVRAALGAGPGRLLRLVLGRTTRTVLAGLGAGLFLAGLAGRTIQLQVGGMPPVDFAAAGPIAALVASAAMLGALGPAMRASRAAPARVLRE